MTQSARACSPIIPTDSDYNEYKCHMKHINTQLTESQVHAI